VTLRRYTPPTHSRRTSALSLAALGSCLSALLYCFSAILVAAIPQRANALDPETSRAVHADLSHGRADDGIARLRPALSQDPHDTEAHNLLCRIYFAEERWDDAVHECEASTREAPQSSEYHMWLGRAYGEKASRVSFISAYRMGQRVRAEFETAVARDPHNAEALADLGEFYSEAPSMVGGGTDKADEVVRKMEPLDAARAHELKGRIAAQNKDLATAEAEFKTAVRVSHSPAASWTVLASLYRKQQRWDDMMQAIRSAIAADKDHGVASAYAASVLIKANREPTLAIHLLESYLASQKQSEEFPAFLAQVRLGRLMELQGDKQSAKQQFQAARSLAHEFRELP
jgi:tetratricopeptide (TPR) repeat protein